ncbi:TetR/AcrR family transcriptional regulator C-terminal ligand-binding domain-containing protein [Rhodococcus sp. HNM0569]|uniref:TetR/AcrR family transcriptional regulator C-terminal ligand-binding domain-containing protein n=1 Tax=Rhodococcus sp. HNM0569 TaxID=2716340 RepID=UPI00146D301B|nr:TetR/AcrR family transcriptional regulator [Rhodococcus sp. HNM0569]
MPDPDSKTTATSRPTRQRRGGRSEIVRGKVAESVLSFLREGRTDFGVAEVAERAGVHRATVYRWWPTRGDLLAEALTEHGGRLALPDTGSWRGDVSAACEAFAEFLTDPVELALTAALAAHTDAEADRAQFEYWAPIDDQLRQMVRRAIDRGEVRPTTDPRVASLLLIGPISTYALTFRAAPPPDMLAGIAEAITRAHAL